MGAMGVMGWVRVRAAKGIMNSEFWIGHKLQACTSGGCEPHGRLWVLWRDLAGIIIFLYFLLF